LLLTAAEAKRRLGELREETELKHEENHRLQVNTHVIDMCMWCAIGCRAWRTA